LPIVWGWSAPDGAGWSELLLLAGGVNAIGCSFCRRIRQMTPMATSPSKANT
jgi:hypothetical protein